MSEELLSVRQAADRAGVSHQAVYQAIKRGTLPCVQVIGRKAVRAADLDAHEFAISATIPLWAVISRDNTAVIGSGQDGPETARFASEAKMWDYVSRITGASINTVDKCRDWQIANQGTSIEIYNASGHCVLDAGLS
jgi:excisionase family DNA binding protein